MNVFIESHSSQKVAPGQKGGHAICHSRAGGNPEQVIIVKEAFLRSKQVFAKLDSRLRGNDKF